jgi:hypothetical protein
MKSEALSRVISESKTNSKDSLAANKYLLEKKWVAKDGDQKRGRPTREAIKKEAEFLRQEDESILGEDFKRFGLN